MAAVDPPTSEIPRSWAQVPDVTAWLLRQFRWNHDMWQRTGAGVDVVGENQTNLANLTTTVTAMKVKTDFITVTQDVNLDTIESELNEIHSASPTYTPTNDSTDRAWDCNAAAGAISNPPTQAEVENLRDSLLELSDVVATLVADFQTKNVLG